MKRDNFNASMRAFPGAQRVTINGKRVWIFEGKQFETRREMMAYKFPAPKKLISDGVLAETDENAATENTAEGWAGTAKE